MQWFHGLLLACQPYMKLRASDSAHEIETQGLNPSVGDNCLDRWHLLGHAYWWCDIEWRLALKFPVKLLEKRTGEFKSVRWSTKLAFVGMSGAFERNDLGFRDEGTKTNQVLYLVGCIRRCIPRPNVLRGSYSYRNTPQRVSMRVNRNTH